MPTGGTSILQSEMDALAILANAKLLPLVNAVIAANPGYWLPHFYSRYSSGVYPTGTIANPQPNYLFDPDTKNWVSELNRIRGDYWNMIFGFSGHDYDSPVYLSSNNLVSGEWIVGVNDPDTYPAVNVVTGELDPTQQGILFGDLNNVLCAYRNVSFIYAFDDAPDGLTITGTLSDASVFSTSGTPYSVNGIHPTSQIMRVDCLTNTADPTAKWTLSLPLLKGVWVANTLPVPGNNVFIDQDMPPYVGAYFTSTNNEPNPAKTAIFTMLPWLHWDDLDNPPTGQYNNALPVLASSMRQQSMLPHGTKYNLISQSEQCQPAQWLVKRDTDFIPFNYGFNPNDEESVYSGISLGTGEIRYDAFPRIQNDAVSLKIRLVTSTSEGWQDGQFIYGQPLSVNLKIFVSTKPVKINPSDPSSYDFVTTNNEVTIPTDGGSGYLQTILDTQHFFGFQFATQNDTATDVVFDLITEINTTAYPQRQYFPVCNECYSYSITTFDPIPNSGVSLYSTYQPKPVPQSGYCIFKVRVTRLPANNMAGISVTPSSGNEIVVTIGQNKLQEDGTLVFTPFYTENGLDVFTVTIPANAGDSGDVDVFWPVLVGNEIVWHCDSTVIVEAWANWQPIWFAGIYGFYYWIFGNNWNGLLGNGLPTSYQNCLAFKNSFSKYYANYSAISPMGYTPETTVQFPLDKAIYNDLETCLNLIS